jgi:DNA polymerase III subunit gamma/tau
MKLDLKFRPQIFDEVIGQEVPVTLLKSIIRTKRYSSAYLFSGPTGVGKTTLGRIFAKAILCSNPEDGNPCCICESCLLFQQEQHFGYMELDAASVGGKDDMVKLRDEAAFQSVGGKKIILLDECHDISKQGQDALLKQVEQCPDHLIYIFCTTEPEKLKRTLRKRCTQFHLSRVSGYSILGRLKHVCTVEGIVFEEDALKIIAEKSGGHVRDSLKSLEEISYLGPITVENVSKIVVDYDADIFNILLHIGSNLPTALETCKKISSNLSVREVYDQVLSMVNDTVKLIYGFDDFLPNRKMYLSRLKDVYGYGFLEFLNYLISRDKFVDRVGLQSDIILLHYKFCANSFQPQQVPVPVKSSENTPEQIPIVSSTISSSPPAITHAQLSKMSVKDRAAILREQRRNVPLSNEESDISKIPTEWSLPKNERLGANSFDDVELSPLEFSQRLVGGRGGIL